MSDAPITTAISPSFLARLGAAARYAISGVGPESWFGPQQPLAPQAPPDVKGRQWDYPFGVNLNYTPRADAGISFAELRALADALPLLRLLIETRKDQIAGLNHTIRARDPKQSGSAAPRIAQTLAFLSRPDRRHSFEAWLRMWLEDMLVIDAATIYPRFTRGGDLYSLDVVDGSTIAPLVGEDGRSPEPPDPAYQQVLHGVPAADFSADELLYLPRNPRPHRLYGMSPVEQVAMTINIALRRDMATLDYYRLGSTPDAFATLPKEWTLDQIKQFQDYFDALMSGNSARRRMVKFMPSDFKLTETRQPPLKDQYDEWLARVICYAFSIPPSPFVSQVNRATSESMRVQASQEGLVPLKAWVKTAMDHIVQVYLNQPDLEFAWVGDDAVDPLQQAQTLSLLVGAGIKSREEARAELGLAPEPMTGTQPTPVTKHGGGNPYHNEQGQFTSSENAVTPGSQPSPGGRTILDIISDLVNPNHRQPSNGSQSAPDPTPPQAVALPPGEPHPNSNSPHRQENPDFRGVEADGGATVAPTRNFTAEQLDLLPPEVRNYVLENGWAKYLGHWVGVNHQCASLTHELFPDLGFTPEWRPGVSVRDDPSAPAGTPIATASNRWPDGTMRYGPVGRPEGDYGMSHTGILMGRDAGGLFLLNQYRTSHGAVITYFPWDSAWGVDNHLESGRYYYTIVRAHRR